MTSVRWLQNRRQLIAAAMFCRRQSLERALEAAQLSPAEREERIKDLHQQESAYMRMQRQKLTVDHFESIKLIGKGAFGEARRCHLGLWSVCARVRASVRMWSST